jgi:hypothetical protein
MNKLDFLSTKPQLFILGKERFTTDIGKILGVICAALIIALSIYFFSEMIRRHSINIYSYSYITHLPLIDMSEFPIMMTLQNGNGVPYDEEERLFRIYGLHADFGNYSNVKYTPIYLEKCDINKHFGKYQELFKDIPYFERYHCMPLNKFNLTVFGKYGNSATGFSFLNFDVDKCMNLSRSIDPSNGIIRDSTNCFTDEKIQTTFFSSFISIAHVDIYIDHNNITTPTQVYARIDLLPVSTSIYKRYFRFMKVNHYDSDSGFIFESIESETNFQVDFDTNAVDLRKDAFGKFSQISFVMNDKEEKFVRSFIKFQNALANIGGVVKVILLIGTIMSNYISDKLFYIFLSNEYLDFGIHKSNQNINHILSNFKIPKQSEAAKNILYPKISIIKKTTELKLSRLEIICPSSICLGRKEKENFKVLENCIKYFRSIMSFDTLLKLHFEVEKIKKLILTEEQVPAFYSIQKLKFDNKINEAEIRYDIEQFKSITVSQPSKIKLLDNNLISALK